MEDHLEDKDQDEDDLCIVCWEQMREVIFYHCMHMVRFYCTVIAFLSPMCKGFSLPTNLFKSPCATSEHQLLVFSDSSWRLYRHVCTMITLVSTRTVL